ncbi:2,3,4,5-tetrahydropyridine-2,6-dicarboxylate N-succinyltransferase [Microbacterium esteraromaticum]|uniref:2,3,4,5-tetrahydropyridine-2,6-dicarboxylate N-succinyltransferase n=1 Tax=Microbacterium esteraromaticum TaxID=57043 RepID=A0A1R4JCY0_9MICO|nr:2,3,4,5-tetrahydropyridine-2,6-dicarboxylate N-succinyltransferase [Microbacterium esteraromaticum]SJN29950.1 2,3,4,5-tetrahydropyridine-2,6-dicarboxylate N-succinyltransferase [Microbacterium esteraromaticum]
MNSARTVWGIGLTTVAAEDIVLDAWFPELGLGAAELEGADADRAEAWNAHTGADERRAVTVAAVRLSIDLDSPPASTADAYLRLHALSHLLVRPNDLNLDGIFAHLPTVAWTNAGPLLPADAARLRPHLQRNGIQVQGIDKFPRLTDYVQPKGVRIADASRVRLGAHLSPGTVVMHEGFVNFNAGTLGAAMVEGRISQGVTIGDGSDIGGGASIMGTLSGGGAQRITIGARTLLGANAGIGISLGDDCIVEAGLYLTAGTKVVLVDAAPTNAGTQPTVKAAELSGGNGLLFRRNSLSGAVEVLQRAGRGVQLNDTLHA